MATHFTTAVRVACFVLLAFASGTRAAEPATGAKDFLVEVWDTDSGLPHNTVTSIAQTPDGYLWVATLHGGLARFDGVRFVTFDPGNAPELRSLEIQKLLVDSEGTLWVGVVDGAVASYRDGRFRSERPPLGPPQAWLSGVISSDKYSVVLASGAGFLFQGTRASDTNQWETLRVPGFARGFVPYADRQGIIWYRTTSGKLGRVRGNQVEIPDELPGLPDVAINTLTMDAEGFLWVGTQQGLARWSGQAFVDMNPPGSDPGPRVLQISPGPEGSLWVRTSEGLRKYQDGKWVSPLVPWNWLEPRTARSWGLFADSRGGAWLTHYGDGLWHVGAGGVVSQVREEQGLPNNLVESWFEDREGNIWIGLTGGGLACVRERTFHRVWPAEGLPHTAARSVCQDRDGAMWFGTSGNRLLRWQAGEMTNFIPPVGQTVGLDLSVCPDATGRLWVGSVQNGLLALKNGQFERPFPSRRIGTVVRVLFADRAERLWVGNEFGLYCIEGGKLKQFSEADGFAPAFVSAITEDKDGTLWIGTALGRLRRYKDGEFTDYWPKDSPLDLAVTRPPSGARPRLITGARCWALHADEAGILWIGTLGAGLLRFEEGGFTRYGTREGLPSEHVSQILEDANGRLWLGTRAGITRVHKADLNAFARGAARSVPMVTYGKLDGLPSIDCSGGTQPACWRDRDGHLWFTTAKGAVWTDPSDLRSNSRPPPVHLEEVAVDGKRVGEDGQPSANPIPQAPRALQVPAGPHLVEFKFTAPSLVSPDKVRFQSRLLGLEADWQPESKDRSARYSFIPPGNYEFQVRACNNDGLWSEQSASLTVTVLAYFWQTLWFKTIALTIAFSLGLGAVLWSFRRRHRLQIERMEHEQALTQERVRLADERLAHQQAMEQERARIAQDLHDDLGASLTQISWLGESVRLQAVPTSEHQNLVAQITAKSRDMVRAIDEIVWAVNPKNDSLDHLVTYICEFAEQFFAGTGTLCRVDVQESLPVHPLASDVRHNLFLAVKEALHNVAKHSHAAKVYVRIRVEQPLAIFTVEDEGCGFDPGRSAGGDGLENMVRRASAIGAQFSLRSAPGQGTSVIWKLPLDTAAPVLQNHP